jgi:antitoxin (DNA-binding transcriptional repressor) of toxin-antitoxin stability system
MINATIHETKTNLSKFLQEVENRHQVINVFRNKTLVARIVPVEEKNINPLTMHSELMGVKFYADPMEPLAEDEWPQNSIL